MFFSNFKSQNNSIFFISLFLSLSLFSGFGDILLIKDYFIRVPEPKLIRYREFLEIKQYSIYFKYAFIFLVFLINIFFFIRLIKKLKIITKQNYWLIHIFFIFLIISYLYSYFIYLEFKYLKKVILMTILYNSFLFFTLNEINQNFTKALTKSIEITFILTLIIFLIVNFIGNQDNNYFEFVNWPRHTGIISFVNIRGNPITFILLSLYACYLKFEKNQFNRFLILFIVLFLIFMLQSRLGIISIILLTFLFNLNKTKYKKFYLFLFYLSLMIIFAYTFFGAKITNFLFEIFVNQINIIQEPYSYFENIKKNCPFAGYEYSKIFYQNCEDFLFKVSASFGKSPELFNFLTSFLYRMSYQYEALNIVIDSNFKPVFKEFSDLGNHYVTDIGIIRFRNNLFTNPHNSYLLITLRLTIFGTILIFTFFYLLGKELIKVNEFDYLITLIFILFFHSFDDFLAGNHLAASLITWIMLGIFFNKIKNDQSLSKNS